MSPPDFASIDDRQAPPRRSLATRFVRAVALVLAALLGIALAAGAVLLATALYALRAASTSATARTKRVASDRRGGACRSSIEAKSGGLMSGSRAASPR